MSILMKQRPPGSLPRDSNLSYTDPSLLYNFTEKKITKTKHKISIILPLSQGRFLCRSCILPGGLSSSMAMVTLPS